MDSLFNQNKFDSVASSYDDVFTNSPIGILQRLRVYYWLNKFDFFDRKKIIFEINCGTGYDAEEFSKKGHKVIATDASVEMIRYSKKHRNTDIDFSLLGFEKITQETKLTQSNVLFSNFGGLNCISNFDLTIFANKVAEQQKAKDLLIWVIMPKKCLMESLYFFFTFQWNLLFRRNTKKGIPVNVDGNIVNTYYHSPNELKKILKDQYYIRNIKPIAIFLPPSYLNSFFKKHTKILSILNRLENVFGRLSFLASWADHYIIIAEKK